MKKQVLKDMILKERETLDIPISDKLKNTNINGNLSLLGQEIETTTASFKHILLMLMGFCFFVFLGISTLVTILPPEEQRASELTSYIIEMNNSNVCVTTDSYDNVVGYFSLSGDGDKVLVQLEAEDGAETLSCFIEKYVYCTISNNIIEEENEGEIFVYVVNNKHKTAKERGKNFTELLMKKLKEYNCNVRIQENILEVSEFAAKIGLDTDCKDLDEFGDDMVKYYDSGGGGYRYRYYIYKPDYFSPSGTQ